MLLQIKKLAQKFKFALVVIGEERKDRTAYLGPASIGHIVDVIVKMKKGLDGEVVISSSEKNRDTGDETSRCFFRRTSKGFVEMREAETGYLPRHSEEEIIGFAPFVTRNDDGFFVDEITAVTDRVAINNSLTIVGISFAKAKSLLSVLYDVFNVDDISLVLRANRTEKNLGDAELACMIAALSLILKKPIPVGVVFIGDVDNRGYLIPVEGMEQRVKRAKALGYKRIIGPKANGLQEVTWEEAEAVEGVWKALGFAK
jgi:DNA repair protein RadA/Sms